MEFIEVTGKTIEEAIEKGKVTLQEKGCEIESYKVLEEPSKGLFGFGKKDALLRIYYVESANMEENPVVEAVAVAPEVVAPVEEVVKEEVTVPEVAEEDVEEDEQEDEKPVAVELSEEAAKRIADRAKSFLYEMFEKMGLKVVIEKMTTKDRVTFQVHGEDLGVLIGKHGQTLDSIQYLTNLVANKGEEKRLYIMVDVEGYRARREQTLAQLAKRLAEKVKRTRHRVQLEPMNAYERKVIHLTLQDMPNISTTSDGEGTNRHVVISYVK